MAVRIGDVASWRERLTRISAEITNVKEVVVVVVEIYCTVIASFCKFTYFSSNFHSPKILHECKESAQFNCLRLFVIKMLRNKYR